jgi:hypothetical protein
VSRVDVYAVTAPGIVPDSELLRLGARIGSVTVKSPRDPDRTVEAGESASDIEPLEGQGMDQGARARMTEQLTAEALSPVAWPGAADVARLRAAPGVGAPTGTDVAAPARTYVGVSIDTRGRPGPMSRRVSVPVVSAPPAPSAATVTYDERAVTIRWAAPSADSEVTYHVYDVPEPSAPAEPAADVQTPPSGERRLTSEPIAETSYADERVLWGARRCYAVRSVVAVGALTVESNAPSATCVTLADTFAPAPPKGLTGVASEASISLIWEASGEKDLAGYIVMRGLPGAPLTAITPLPIQATIFNDAVQPGVRYVYAIAAVDTAGNRSGESNRFEEAGRN